MQAWDGAAAAYSSSLRSSCSSGTKGAFFEGKLNARGSLAAGVGFIYRRSIGCGNLVLNCWF